MSLQIRTNKVCSCRGPLLSQRLHNIEEKRLHAFSMRLTQKNAASPPRPSCETSLAPLLNANALTSCQTLLILLAPKIISPNPKSSPSPQILGLWEGVYDWYRCKLVALYFLLQTLPSQLATPFGTCGKCTWKGLEAWCCSGGEGCATCCSGWWLGPRTSQTNHLEHVSWVPH